MRHSFKTNTLCRICEKWRELGLRVCPECGKKVSHRARGAKAKDQTRWKKAY